MSRDENEAELDRVKIPELAKMVYGEGAALGWATAGERLRRWAAAFDEWLAEEARLTSPKCSRDFHYNWIDFWDGCHKLPWEVVEADVQAWVRQLQAGGRASATIRKKLFALDSFYRYCESHSVDPGSGPGFNPAGQVKCPPANKRQRGLEFLNLEETRALLEAIDRDQSLVGLRDYALVLATLRSGREIGEIRLVKWGLAGVTPPFSSQDVGQAIEAYLRAAGRWEGMQPGEYIFAPLANPLKPVREGRAEDWNGSKPLSTALVRFLLKRYACWAGLDPDRVSWTCLRYTAGMIRLEMGDELEEVAAFLGLKSVAALRRSLHKFGRGAVEWHPRFSAETLEVAKKNLHQPEKSARKRPIPKREVWTYPRRKPRAQPGNTQALKHGLYSKKKPEEILSALLSEQKVRGGEVVGLKAEVLGLRILLGQLFGRSLEKVETPEELMKVLDHFGKNAVRLSVLLRAEKELDGGESELQKMLSQAISEVAEELRNGGEGEAETGGRGDTGRKGDEDGGDFTDLLTPFSGP